MAGRIRTVKPQLFQHEGLNDLETEHVGKHIMLTFIGLFTQADGAGRFEWKPRTLKLHILPFVTFDIEDTLNILCNAGHIVYYVFEGKAYGQVVNFTKHQRIIGREYQEPSKLPQPPDVGRAQRQAPQPSPAPTKEAPQTTEIPPLQLIADHMADTLADLHGLTVEQVADKAATEAQKFLDFYKNGQTKAGAPITDWEKLADIWASKVPKGKVTEKRTPRQAKATPQTTEKSKIKWREP